MASIDSVIEGSYVPEGQSPSVCVIIPTLNAEDRIGRILEAVRRQSVAAEVLVIDSSSDDGTLRIVESVKDVRLRSIPRSEFNHGATRHLGVRSTSADFLCFLTDDAVPRSDDWLEKLLAPFVDPNVALVFGRQIPRADARPAEVSVRNYNYGPKSYVRTSADIDSLGLKAFFASDSCAAYRRTHYVECGGFPFCSTNEDMLMASRFLRAGRYIAYAADAEVEHSHNLTFREQYRRNRAIGIFLAEHAAELDVPDEVGEGRRLAIAVSRELLAQANLIELVRFWTECAIRLIGNRVGRKKGAARSPLGGTD